MATIGNTVALSAGQGTDYQAFNGDGTTTAFTLKRSVGTSTDIEVVVENVQQQPGNGYSAVGTTLTFSSAPPVGTANVYVVFSASALSLSYVPTLASITSAMMATGAPTWTAAGETMIAASDATVTIGNYKTLGYPKMQIRGTLASHCANGSASGSTLSLIAPGTANSQSANISFHSTFANTPGDNGPRRCADIWAGYDGGAWGKECILFGVGLSGGAANDSNSQTLERMRITGNGGVFVGTYGGFMTDTAGRLQLQASAAQLAMRSSSTAAGKFWYLGPDSNNNTTLYNQAGAGVYITDGGTSWAANSDARLKKNVEVVEDGLDKLMQIRPVKYHWNTQADDEAKTYGVIAQDVQAVAPEITTVKKHDEYDFDVIGVKQTELIPLLIASIQELKREFEEYKRTHP